MRARRGGGVRWRGGLGSRRRAGAQIQARGTEPLFNVIVAAQGALHQGTLLLALEVVLGAKPALKDMALPTLEVEHLHGNTRGRRNRG